MNNKPKAGDVIEIKGFILSDKFGGLVHSTCELPDYDYITITPYTLSFTVPPEFNPIASEVAAIDKKLDAMADEYHGKVRQLNQRKQDLLCIEHTPSAAS